MFRIAACFSGLLMASVLSHCVTGFTSPSLGTIEWNRHITKVSRMPLSGSVQAEQDQPMIRPEYAALGPGTCVKLKVGNIEHGRKAWKKRRRSGSPLLVPCSILDMDRKSMVRWNILYLVEKFGTPLNELSGKVQSIGLTGKGVTLSLAQIGKLYKSHLGTSLKKHAQALGYDSSRTLFRNLFHRKVQKEYGLRVWQKARSLDKEEDKKNPIWLVLPISRHRARSMASQVGLVQFEAEPPQEDSSEDDEKDENHMPRMKHTGRIRVKTPKSQKITHLSLSAALRVSQHHVDEGRIQNGSVLDAVVFSYDAAGDGGSPLLTCSLSNNNNNEVRYHFKQLVSVQEQHHVSRTASLRLDKSLDDLHVGDGPFKAKVLKVSTKSHAAFVDANVGRVQGKQRGGGMARVLGMLRFEDLTQPTPTRGNKGLSVRKQSAMYENEVIEMDTDEAMTLEDLFENDQDDDEMDDLSSADSDSIEELFEVDDDEEEDEEVVANADDADDDATDEELKTLLELFRDELSEDEAGLLETAISTDEAEGSEEAEQEEEDIVEDITDLFTMSEDGLTYKDPETGELQAVDNDDFEDEEMDAFEGEDDEDGDFQAFAGMTPQQRLDAISKLLLDDGGSVAAVDDEGEDEEGGDVGGMDMKRASVASKSTTEEEYPTEKREPLFVNVGDTVDVYIKAVSKQSGRFMVTTDPSVQGKKAKDLKQKKEADKKKSKLISQLGGMNKITNLKGTECDGVVKATSNTGDWYYVQPELENVPVGVAKLVAAGEESTEESSISQGDVVRVRFDGIDESRGQLSMTVLEKLSP